MPVCGTFSAVSSTGTSDEPPHPTTPTANTIAQKEQKPIRQILVFMVKPAGLWPRDKKGGLSNGHAICRRPECRRCTHREIRRMSRKTPPETFFGNST